MLAFFFGVIMKIIKISAYLDKVRKLQIEDPLLLLTTYLDDNYFKLIDWNKTKDQNSLLTEINNAINKMSSNINEDWKKILFSPEIKHNFHQSVPFIYIVLTTISNKTKNIDDVVLEQLYEKLKTQKELSSKKILKIYEDIYAKKEKGISTTEDLDFDFILKGYTGWLLIPGKITPDTVKYQEDARNLSDSFENYKNRELLLKHVSCGTGWCTGQGMEKEYLPRGDFWKYMINGKAKASIRFDDDQIAEMQGLNNNNTNAYIYADAYIALAQKYPQLGIQNVTQGYGLSYNKLLEGKEKVKYYSQASVEEIVNNINEAFYYLTDSVIERYKNNELFNNAIINVFLSLQQNDFLSNINRFSYLKKNDRIRRAAKIIGDRSSDNLEQIIELNQLFDNELYNKEEMNAKEEVFVQEWEDTLKKRIFDYIYVPDWIIEKYPERIEKYKEAYLGALENRLKTNIYYYVHIPNWIKERYSDRIVRKYEEDYIQHLENDSKKEPLFYENIPKWVKEKYPERMEKYEEAYVKKWENDLKINPSFYFYVPDGVRQKYQERMHEAYAQGWENYLETNPNYYNNIPDWIKENYPERMIKYEEAYIQYLENGLKEKRYDYRYVPKWVKEKYPERIGKYDPNKKLSSKNTNWYKKHSTIIKISSLIFPTEYIYDSFLIGKFINLDLVENYQKEEIKEHINLIKKTVILVFLKLMRAQIEKYLTKSDRHIDKYKKYLEENYRNATASMLKDMFNIMTTRSLRARQENPDYFYNSNWGKIASVIEEIENTNDTMNIIQLLTNQNGLFNLVHNTGTPVVDKLENGSNLLNALEECHTSRNPKELLNKSSYNIREIILEEIRRMGF